MSDTISAFYDMRQNESKMLETFKKAKEEMTKNTDVKPNFTIDEDDDLEMVDHPTHYGGKDNPYEAIKVIEAWEVGFNLGNTLKYISRAGKKDDIIQDLEKALFYLDREIQNRKK
jgi:hypothetical protein